MPIVGFVHLERTYILPVGQFVVGRGDGCDIKLVNPTVSREHARIIVRTERVVIRDLSSSHGVIVNSSKLVGPKELEDGDEVALGTEQLKFFIKSGMAPLKCFHYDTPESSEAVGSEIYSACAGHELSGYGSGGHKYRYVRLERCRSTYLGRGACSWI